MYEGVVYHEKGNFLAFDSDAGFHLPDSCVFRGGGKRALDGPVGEARAEERYLHCHAFPPFCKKEGPPNLQNLP